MAKDKEMNRYERIILDIFRARHARGAQKVPSTREDLTEAAQRLGVKLPKNLGDLIYSFKFRTAFPKEILALSPKGKHWVIRGTGRARYSFVASSLTSITPRANLAVTKVPDATPGIIERYALNDEQALLAELRYNRLVDIFTGITCYSLQSHLRTTAHDIGQVETDDMYVGVDRKGAHYVFPVQAKGGKDKQSPVQAEQDFAMCREKFPLLTCRPIAAQFMKDDVIAMFELEMEAGEIAISAERHYKLVPQENITPQDLQLYSSRLSES